MTPLATMLVGKNAIFASQSDFARKVSVVSPRDYPNFGGTRALINQVCLGQRKVPDSLRKAIMDLLNGKPDHLVSAVSMEIKNHNEVVVPMMRKQEKGTRSRNLKSVQDVLCRSLVKVRLVVMLGEMSIENTMAQFAKECRVADPEIGDRWRELFLDLLKEMSRNIK